MTNHQTLPNGTITQIQPFVPHEYQSLQEADRQTTPAEHYSQYVNWYNQVTDIACEKITYISDGLRVVGIITKPKLINQNSKLPVIIYCRGGNEDRRKVSIVNIKENFYPFVQNGYVVIASQYRGNDGGEGKDELGGADVNDVLALFDTLKSLDYVDINNIFMIGFSRGPINIYQCLKAGKKPNAIAGITDLIQFDNEFPFTKETLRRLILKRVEDYEVEYQKRSAVFWSEKINVPVLFLHGDNDEIVNITQSQQLAALLDQAHAQYKLITFSGGDHFLNDFKNELNNEILAWFENYKK